jgi:integrase
MTQDMTSDEGAVAVIDSGALARPNAAAQAKAYAQAAMAPNTSRAYRTDWADFQGWCDAVPTGALPATPVIVGTYLADRAETLAVATLERRLAAVATAHRLAGHQLDTRHPAIRDVMRGIRNIHGTAQRGAAPATTVVIKAMVDSCGEGLLGLRDRALLLIGFAGALRRSELVALTWDDLAEEADGLRITIRRSKTDQEGEGQMVGILRTGTPTCPVAALQAWREAVQHSDGPVFRSVDRHGWVGTSLSDRAVALIVKRRAEVAGLDPALFSGHSLRAGLATSAAAAGLEERDIQRQTRHRSVEQLRTYIREGSLFRANVTGGVGL